MYVCCRVCSNLQLSICQGDYKMIQEVLMDNFAELPPKVEGTAASVPANVTRDTARPEQLRSRTSSSTMRQRSGSRTLAELGGGASGIAPQKQQQTASALTETAVSFAFKMSDVTIDLFTGEHNPVCVN